MSTHQCVINTLVMKPEGNGPLDERATMHDNELKSQNLT